MLKNCRSGKEVHPLLLTLLNTAYTYINYTVYTALQLWVAMTINLMWLNTFMSGVGDTPLSMDCYDYKSICGTKNKLLEEKPARGVLLRQGYEEKVLV